MNPNETFADYMEREDRKEKKRKTQYSAMRARMKRARVRKTSKSSVTEMRLDQMEESLEITDERIITPKLRKARMAQAMRMMEKNNK